MQLIGYGSPTSSRLDATFAALSDPTRRAILARLMAGEASVLELAEPFAMTQPAISKHIKVLEKVGLVAEPLAEATDWLEGYRKFWEAQYRRLDVLLDELQAGAKQKKKSKRKPHP